MITNEGRRISRALGNADIFVGALRRGGVQREALIGEYPTHQKARESAILDAKIEST
jgi:hypothetical protein